jgi:hypothetical protein
VFGGRPGKVAESELVMLPAVPSGPVLPYQQFPRFERNSSHQKSEPLGIVAAPFSLWGTPYLSRIAGNVKPGGTCPSCC